MNITRRSFFKALSVAAVGVMAFVRKSEPVSQFDSILREEIDPDFKAQFEESNTLYHRFTCGVEQSGSSSAS